MPFSYDEFQERDAPLARLARLLVPVIYVAAAGAFVADLMRTNTLAYGIIYIPLIGTGLLHRKVWTLFVLTGICVTMVTVGAIFPYTDPDLHELLSNRILSILAILATTALVYHSRTIQDRLADATERAEAAERIRTDILSNLGREMRTPLHTTIAMLGLLLTNCRPDQRAPLGKMRAGSQQLLLTLDNLIALTQIDEHLPNAATTDVAKLLRDAVANARTMAEDCGVRLELSRQVEAAEERFDGCVDPFLTRRVLDNLLFNAIRVTRPSGAVCAVVRQEPATIVVTVSDSGTAMPEALAQDLQQDQATMTESLMTPAIGVGLTLARRLAEAMGGTLAVRPDPAGGSSVTLRLPQTAPKPA